MVLQCFKFGFAAIVQFYIAVFEYLYGFLNLFYHGSSCLKDGVELVMERVDEGSLIVAYLFNHETEGVVGVFQIEFFVSYINKCLKAEYLNIFDLCCHLL